MSIFLVFLWTEDTLQYSNQVLQFKLGYKIWNTIFSPENKKNICSVVTQNFTEDYNLFFFFYDLINTKTYFILQIAVWWRERLFLYTRCMWLLIYMYRYNSVLIPLQ